MRNERKFSRELGGPSPDTPISVSGANAVARGVKIRSNSLKCRKFVRTGNSSSVFPLTDVVPVRCVGCDRDRVYAEK